MDLLTHKRRLELKARLYQRLHDDKNFTIEEAEKLAIDGGLKSLFEKPDPEKFDPMLEEDWTFLMVMAWAMWRTVSAVRSHSESFAEYSWYLEENQHGGVAIVGPDKITRDNLQVAESLSSLERPEMLTDDPVAPLVLSYKAAYAELRAATIGGELTFEAVEFASGEVLRSSEVPLSGFECKPLKNGDIAVYVRERAKYGVPIFRQSNVLRLWPQILPVSANPRSTTIASETQCGEHLLSLMSNGSTPEKNKREYQAEMTAEFDISIRAFQRQWSLAIEKTGNTNWNKSGPKSPVRDSVSKRQ